MEERMLRIRRDIPTISTHKNTRSKANKVEVRNRKKPRMI